MKHECRCGRRDFVKLTLGASAGAAISAKFGLPLLAQDAAAAKAKQCILLWMAGAPSQLDTFDPKPGSDTGGPFKAIPTAADGIEICEHLPRVAKQMRNISLLRTVNSKDPNHDTATYMLHTGYRRAPDLEHPHIGSVVVTELGEKVADLPGCVVLGGDPPAGAGYLSSEKGPLVLDKLENPTEDLGEPPFVDRDRLARRNRLREWFEKDFQKDYGDDPRVEARKRAYERANRVLTSDNLKAFEIKSEPDETRRAYGDSDFGRAVLIARRLIQTGVRFVEVQLGDWDTHTDNFTRVKRNLGILDPAYAALMDDLARTKLLESTLVVWMGEFGRTPGINASNGRDHFTRAWSVAMSGGGIQGGRVVGRTDENGMAVKDRPVSVGDLYATMYKCFGIDAEKKYSAGKRPMKVLDGGEPVKELF